MDHTVDMQVFHADHAKTVNDLPGCLMGEIITPEVDTLMHTSHNFAMLSALRRPFSQFGVLALDTDQGLLFLAEKARIGYLFTSGEGSKGCEPNINTNLSRGFWKAFRLTLDRERHVPFPCTPSLNDTRFDRPFDRSMIDHLHAPNLGKGYTIIMGETETGLRESEAIIAVFAPEAREARRFTCFAASEKGFEGQINAHGNMLQHLGMNSFKRGAFLFQDRIGRLLLIARQTFSHLLRHIFALFKQVVVQSTTLIKGLVQLLGLPLRREHAILKHFTHVHLIHFITTIVNGQGTPIPCSKHGTLFIPRMNDGGFQAI